MLKLALALVFLPISNVLFAQRTDSLNLSELQGTSQLQIVNRTAKVIIEDGKKFIRISENEGEGLIWLPINGLTNGVVEIEMRGKDVFQRSFIGLAFHGLNDSTYDAVYCRPFNFFAEDSIRKIHAIQYISHPSHTWKKLREERNGMFEKGLVNPPNPNGWFTMRLVVTGRTVQAFINRSKVPSLVVGKLNERSDGKVGIFMGDGSGGDFFRVTVKKHNSK